MQRCDSLIAGNVQLLAQGIHLIERLDDASYANANGALSLDSPGSHFRHCVDFYNCFLETTGRGGVNYDRRRRNEAVEGDRALAIAEIEKIIAGLRKLLLADGQKELRILLEESAAPRAASAWGRSSVMRELQFLLSHTIHHYAMIAVSLRLRGFEPGEEFGVAPSTLEYWRRTA